MALLSAMADSSRQVQFYGGGAKGLADARPASPAEKEAHAEATRVEKQLQDVTTKIVAAEQADAPERALAVRDADEPANINSLDT